ncbi:MAG: nucleotidyltransferase family protein [Gemmatimonadaceae bacterium]
MTTAENPLLERLPAEARLLLLAADPASRDDEVAQLLAQHTLDWESLIALADRERASALLWRRIRPFVPGSIPAEIRERMERMAMVADFSASYLEQRIGETLAHLEADGATPIVLKGAALAATVYGSFADRPMGDIDLIVEATQAGRLWESVQRIGWRWDTDRYPSALYAGHHHLPPLDDSRGLDVRLELHTDLFVSGSPFPLDAPALRARGTRIEFGKGHAIVPSREHLLLHACIHFTWSHMMSFGSWRAFRDVAALSTAGLDWELFEAEARRNRAESSCYWTLRLAERLVGASLPEGLMTRLRRSTDAAWSGLCERHVIGEIFRSEHRCPSLWLRRLLWEQAIQPGRAGHGDVRPWLLDDLSPENLTPERREGGVLRMLRHFSRAGSWYRYARVLAR